MMNAHSTCPACGYETLETIEMAEPGSSSGMATGYRSLMLFECMHCLWQGSTATLNSV